MGDCNDIKVYSARVNGDVRTVGDSLTVDREGAKGCVWHRNLDDCRIGCTAEVVSSGDHYCHGVVTWKKSGVTSDNKSRIVIGWHDIDGDRGGSWVSVNDLVVCGDVSAINTEL